MNKTYKSEILASVHEAASDIYELGLMDKKTMRQFDESCLAPLKKLTPEEIRAIRETEQMSLTVFSLHLGLSPRTVRRWESGERSPRGASLKLLTLVKMKGVGSLG